MSRYPHPDFRGPRDRSRSPPRFDRRQSAASVNFENRRPPPASEAPRGPRGIDGPRPPLLGGTGSTNNLRQPYNSLREAPPLSSLRDAPPLGSGDRGRPFRERDWERDRRDRLPSPRERSPSRGLKDVRDFPPRDLDIGRGLRGSRDGPLPTGSNFADNPPFAPSQGRGGYPPRGRGRGDFPYRGRGGRSNLDERDLFRRERSPPPPRWGARDLSRDDREPERRERFERREDDRRPPDWVDRERERDADRIRREQPPPRLDSWVSTDSLAASSAYQATQAPAPPINPARLALIESNSVDTPVRRPSVQQDVTSAREARREIPETPSYMNGRAETTANRYASRGSSPPTQAPPVPAFTLSFAPSAPSRAQSAPRPQPSPQEKDTVTANGTNDTAQSQQHAPQDAPGPPQEQKPEPPPEAPTAPKAPPPGPRAQLVSPPVAAPRGPRAFENDDFAIPGNRLHGVRSLENLPGPNVQPGNTAPRTEAAPSMQRPSSTTLSAGDQALLPTLTQPVSPRVPRHDFVAPTGPRATRVSPAVAPISPRPPLASPRSDFGGFSGSGGHIQAQTPPPTAPSGPRNKSFSVSPKVATSSIPTAPKASRGPPVAPRSLERGPAAPSRPGDRLNAPAPWAPPTAPRPNAWNQWRRPGAPAQSDKLVPAKRDVLGEEKTRGPDPTSSSVQVERNVEIPVKLEAPKSGPANPAARSEMQRPIEPDATKRMPKRQPSAVSAHSAARSFFGQPTVDDPDEDTGMSDALQGSMSTSEEEESDLELEDLTLFNAKFERQKRQLEAHMVDLSSRPFRATTPLESIARLSRISIRDLYNVNEQREHEMDVDLSPAQHNRHGFHRKSQSSSSGEVPDILTPKAEDDRRVAICASEDSSESVVRRARKASPEPVSLPYLLKEPELMWSESQALNNRMLQADDSKTDILRALEDEVADEDDADQGSEGAFADWYRRWRQECEDLDRVQEEQERLERHISQEPGTDVQPLAVAPANPIMEGRRLHKYNSEYDVEQVLRASEETARLEQERQDRENKKNQADMEKEAKLPDQMGIDGIRRKTFVDMNTLRNPESLTVVFSYEPPEDTFDEGEQQVFIAAFKDTPKKWGEIASLLPDRTYKDCIHHYYANKWDGRFRDKTKKFGKPGGKRGRGGRARGGRHGIMADMPTISDLAPEAVSEKGRPRRAAAPTTFAEKEAEAKAALGLGPSPVKKPGMAARTDANGDPSAEKLGKRQKRTGEKPGRKPKGSQQALAQLAPQASPAKQFLPGMPGMPTKEDMARQQKLEEASLLTNFHGAHTGMLGAENPMVYQQESYMQPMQIADEPDRSKLAAPSAKQSASSYWSVPEQTDFLKYVAHFGRDFGAIASYMGTKTQTMIKNHYQRQLDGGSRPELETQAIRAEERRIRGEDLGPPPQPTPIVKRKYDNPQPAMQRPLAPHTDAMDIDGPTPVQRAPVPKHASPPQFQAQPRYSTSAQNTPIPATRVAPSPLATAATPVPSQMVTATSRPLQHAINQRMTFMSDTRPEPRPPSRQEPMFRPTQETPPRSQPAQPGRSTTSVPNADYIRNLVEEQERALRMQQQTPFAQQDRIEQIHRTASAHRNSAQNSPLHQPIHHPPERKTVIEEQRVPTPPRFTGPGFGRPPPSLGQSAFGQFGAQPFASIGSRGFDPTPPKREEPRPGSVPTLPPLSAAPPEPPKRSNVMSLLNSEPEEPKMIKRDSAPSIPQRMASPVNQSHAHNSATSQAGIPTPRRDPSFGQPSVSHSNMQRHSFAPTGSAPSPAPPPLKHEHSSGNGLPSQPPKQDWAARVLGQSQVPSPGPPLEREVRPYFQHHHRNSLLGQLGQPRVNPSPPPVQSTGHSRTPSLTQQPREPPREQIRPGMDSRQPTSQQPGQPLQPNPYASQQPSPFPQQTHGVSQSHAHHAHSSSITSPFPILHHRGASRDDLRQDQRQERFRDQFRVQENVRRERERERECEEQQQRVYQRNQEHMEAERRREEQLIAHRRREDEERRNIQRGPPPPMPLQQAPTFSNPAFGHNRNLDLRNQSRMEAEMAVREQEHAQRIQQEADRRRQEAALQHQDHDRRRQEAMLRERDQAEQDYRRRHEESMFRRTPLGGGFGPPPPQPPPGQRR